VLAQGVTNYLECRLCSLARPQTDIGHPDATLGEQNPKDDPVSGTPSDQAPGLLRRRRVAIGPLGPCVRGGRVHVRATSEALRRATNGEELAYGLGQRVEVASGKDR
jgi:hypothetical protein